MGAAPTMKKTAAYTTVAPSPYSPPLEDYVVPQTSDIVTAVRRPAAH